MKHTYLLLASMVFSLQTLASSMVIIDPETNEIITNPSEEQIMQATKELGMEDAGHKQLKTGANGDVIEPEKQTVVIDGKPMEVEFYQIEQ